MKKKTIELYQWDELPEDAKKKVLSNHSDFNIDHEWWDSTYEDAKTAGIKITAFDTDRYCNGDFIEDALFCANAIIENHGETCETYKTAQSFLVERDEIVNAAPKDENGDYEDESKLDLDLDDCEGDFLKSILEDYRIMLKKEYEYLTSDESIIESIKANEYYFDLSGNIQTPDKEG